MFFYIILSYLLIKNRTIEFQDIKLQEQQYQKRTFSPTEKVNFSQVYNELLVTIVQLHEIVTHQTSFSGFPKNLMRTNHYLSRREGGGEVIWFWGNKEGFSGFQQSIKGEEFDG